MPEEPPLPSLPCNRPPADATEPAGIFSFFFRFLFFFFLIALLGGALSFHLLALSALCLLIYFSIYLLYNFLYL